MPSRLSALLLCACSLFVAHPGHAASGDEGRRKGRPLKREAVKPDARRTAPDISDPVDARTGRKLGGYDDPRFERGM